MEPVKQRIISSVLSKRSSSGQQETYVSHVKVWEETEDGGTKARYILLSQTPSGQGFIHKCRMNTNNSFSVGRTWNLSKLRGLEVVNPGAFNITLARTHRLQAEDPREQIEFIAAVVKTFHQLPDGNLSPLSLINFPEPGTNVPDGPGRMSPSFGLRKVAKIHFDELQIFLAQHLAKEPLNSRSSARAKLIRLTRQQFQELSTDVYDELVRRNNHTVGIKVPYLPLRDEFHPKRNLARQKLSTLPKYRFTDLASDIHFELGRRYPECKEPEAGTSVERNRIPLESPVFPGSNPEDGSSPDFHDTLPLPPPPPPASSYSPGPNLRRKPSQERNPPFRVMNVDRHRPSQQSNEYNSSSSTERRRLSENTPFRSTERDTSGWHPSDNDSASTSTSPPPSPPPKWWQELELLPRTPSDLNPYAPALASPPLPLSETNLNAPAPAEIALRHDRPLEPFPRNSLLCLDGKISDQSRYVVASGGFADVYTGSLDNKTVAIKVMRPFSGSGSHIEISKILKRSWREYLAWSRLSHPNILECLGFSYDFSPQTGQPSLISPWMSNGSAINYIKERPNVDGVEIVVGIARGLTYLHGLNPTIVHGDLRAGNVLISDKGTACLSDFGLSMILSDVRGMTTSSELAGSLRWMAPELLRGDSLSTKSDVWAYGMTVLEILTGKRPYSEIAFDLIILEQISKAVLPSRPNDVPLITDDVWTLCQKCWDFSSAERPSMDAVLAEIEGVRG